MVSNKKKGSIFENDCKKKLESEGYIVMKSPRTMRCIGPNRWISQDCDYFNLYDLCAKKNNITKWIQCKVLDENSHGHVAGLKKEIQTFHDKYMCEHESSEIWIKRNRLIEIYQYDNLTKEFINFKK